MLTASALLFALALAPGEASPAASPAASAPAVDFAQPRDRALVVLGSGVTLGIVSAVAFTTGFDAERELQASIHDEASADALLNRRTIAGWVAWPTAVLGAAGVGTGVALLVMDGEP